MHKLKSTFRKAVLYITSVVLIGTVPMSAAFADHSDVCKAAEHYSSAWAVDPTTNTCVQIYNGRGVFIGPEYMRPPAPTPTPTPSSSPTVDPTTGAPAGTTNVTDNGNGNNTSTDNTNNGTSNTSTNNSTNVTNGVDSTANTGTADVKGNQSKGGSTSGDANTQATIVNTVNSSNGTNGVSTFTYDVYGNVVGDIVINGNASPVDVNNTNNLNVNASVNNKTDLTNNVDLNSKSGDATVVGNESAGNAKSGDANTTVNLINLINTIISANKTFVGTINIYGNLDGNIILSSEYIPQLLAANGGSQTAINNLQSNTDINNNTGIVNNINLNAASGSAGVTGNESKGGAATGNAQTNLTVLNLTGHEVNAANSVLVFVNVLGSWVGMIMDAPSGSTAAAFAGGVTSNTTNNVTADTKINNDTTITNNLDLSSVSGNAGVTGNESKGNATSGNATASANVANISMTTINLTDWMSFLFINVYGQWNGDLKFAKNNNTGEMVQLESTPQPAPQTAAAAATPSLKIASKSNPSQFTGASQAEPTIPAPAPTVSQAQADDAAKKLGVPTAEVKNTLKDNYNNGFDPLSLVTTVAGFTLVGASGTASFFRRKK